MSNVRNKPEISWCTIPPTIINTMLRAYVSKIVLVAGVPFESLNISGSVVDDAPALQSKNLTKF